MNSTTVLVIDDSATIRKLVDTHLSQEGYRVVLAPNAEIGLQLAREIRPDLILLDHQLPGTTGLEVCKQIIQFPECVHTPFVISSSLRKQAYAEYMEIPNVVDSLHKPFQPELLKMMVANALEVGSMIVSSQAQGTAVPEVLGDAGKPALSGDLQVFNLREVLDFLNNGSKCGLLEVETERDRFGFYLDGGQIQSVASASSGTEIVAQRLPEALQDLAPLLRFTMSTGFSSHVDGLVELLDKKVLDPRMLRSLLRHQAAVLTHVCFHSDVKGFSFAADRPLPPLFRKTPVNCSLAALLVDGVLVSPPEELPGALRLGWARQTARGQNLDRTGLSARQLQVLSAIENAPVSTHELAPRLNIDADELLRILYGFQLADWIRCQEIVEKRQVVALEPDVKGSLVLRQLLADEDSPWTGKVVRDPFGLKLLLKRVQPDVLVVARETFEQLDDSVTAGAICLIVNGDAPEVRQGGAPVLVRPYKREEVLAALDLAVRQGGGYRPHSEAAEEAPEHSLVEVN